MNRRIHGTDRTTRRCNCAACHERRRELAVLAELCDVNRTRHPIVRTIRRHRPRHHHTTTTIARRHQDPRPLRCDTCGWTTPKPEWLNMHILYRHDRAAA